MIKADGCRDSHVEDKWLLEGVHFFDHEGLRGRKMKMKMKMLSVKVGNWETGQLTNVLSIGVGCGTV